MHASLLRCMSDHILKVLDFKVNYNSLCPIVELLFRVHGSCFNHSSMTAIVYVVSKFPSSEKNACLTESQGYYILR